MSEDQFTKLFKYIEQMRTDMNQSFEVARSERKDIRAAVAELSAQVRDYHNESILLNRQVDKLTEAIKQIAIETGVKLRVEL